jgi:hypothetical protein
MHAMPDVDHRQIALGIARARAVNGLIMLFLPGLAGRAFLGKNASHPAVKAVLRLVGVRDLVLGIGAITTLKEHTMDAEWVGMGAVCDAVDGVVMLTMPGLGFRSRLASLAGFSSAGSGLYAARAIADARTQDALNADAIEAASEINS